MRSRETRGRCLDRSIRLISNSNRLNIGGTPHFIHILGVTVRSKRSTVTMKRPTMDRFKNIVAVGSWMERLDAIVEMRYKTRLIAPLGSHRAVEMRSSPFHHERYNPPFEAHVLIMIDGLRVYAIDARISKTPTIRCIASGHVTCIKDIFAELSPTQRKSRGSIGFIRYNGYEG